MPNEQTMRGMMAQGGTAYWKDIKGLWSKDFTFRPDANNAGYGVYIWTNKADLDKYLEGPIWGMMS